MAEPMEDEEFDFDPLHHVVLAEIFRHLDGTTLKNCRLVSKTWKELSTPEFQKKMKCCIHNCTNSRCTRGNIEKFIRANLQYEFKCFEFQGSFEALELKKFLDCRPFIRELIFIGIAVKSDEGVFDISQWITLNLKELTVVNEGSDLMSVQMSYLTQIKIIYFCGVIIHIGHLNQKICPVELHISQPNSDSASMSVEKIDGEMTDFHFSDYVEVKNLKNLNLRQICEAQVHLDLTECKKLKTLSLATNTKVTGLHKNLVLECLDIDNSDSTIEINLADLPSSFKEFCIQNDSAGPGILKDIQFSGNEPKIKSLTLGEGGDELISLLHRCVNLVRLQLTKEYTLDLSTLPLTLKVITLFLISDKLKFTGTLPQGLNLDKLVVGFLGRIRSLEQLGQMINNLNPKTVVLNNLLNCAGDSGPINDPCPSVCCGRCLDLIFHFMKGYQICFVLNGVYKKEETQQYCQCDSEFVNITKDLCKSECVTFFGNIVHEISTSEFDSYLYDY